MYLCLKLFLKAEKRLLSGPACDLPTRSSPPSPLRRRSIINSDGHRSAIGLVSLSLLSDFTRCLMGLVYQNESFFFRVVCYLSVVKNFRGRDSGSDWWVRLDPLMQPLCMAVQPHEVQVHEFSFFAFPRGHYAVIRSLNQKRGAQGLRPIL